MKDRTGFIKELIDRFPRIKQEILDEDYSQSITLQMGCLKRFAQEAINQDNRVLAGAVLDFLENAVDNVTHDENTVPL